jgi:hypothetical protein
VLNDLAAIKGFRSNVVMLLISVLNGFCEDGLFNIDTPVGKMMSFGGLRGSLIACITDDILQDERHKWSAMGFLSRCIPFAYSLPRDLIIQIKDGIQQKNVQTLAQPEGIPAEFQPRSKKHKLQPVTVEIDENLDSIVRVLNDYKAQQLSEKGIRLLKLYTCLVKAHAFLHGRDKVTDDDVFFLMQVNHYVSYGPDKVWDQKMYGGKGGYRKTRAQLPELGSDTLPQLFQELPKAIKQRVKEKFIQMKQTVPGGGVRKELKTDVKKTA